MVAAASKHREDTALPSVPAFFRWLLQVAGWLAPPPSRAAWRAEQLRAFQAWRDLRDRGELPGARGYLADLARAVAKAFFLRFTPESLRAFVRSPQFFFACFFAGVALLGLATGGFSGTRALLNAGFKLIFIRLLPLPFAAVVAVAVIIVRRPPLPWYGWRYAAFLVVKTAAVVLFVPTLWVEYAHAVGHGLRPVVLIWLLVGLVSNIAVVAGFACAVAWCFADQRRRCPECLSRLVLPVSLGSWASVFDPATTEVVCPHGHGALAVAESLDASVDRWVKLDDSWRELFEAKTSSASGNR